MYCSHCGGQLNYKDLNNNGWCDHCNAIVNTSPCKITFWNLMAILVMAWSLNIVA